MRKFFIKIYVTSFCFPIFTHRGINYPPTYVGPPLSPERETCACFSFGETFALPLSSSTIIPYAPTQWNQLSTKKTDQRQEVRGQRKNRRQTGSLRGFLSDFRRNASAGFPVSQQGGINYPPTYVGPPFFQERSDVSHFHFFGLWDAYLFIREHSASLLQSSQGCTASRIALQFLPTRILHGFADL